MDPLQWVFVGICFICLWCSCSAEVGQAFFGLGKFVLDESQLVVRGFDVAVFARSEAHSAFLHGFAGGADACRFPGCLGLE